MTILWPDPIKDKCRTPSALLEDLYLPRHYCGSIGSRIHYLINKSHLRSSFNLEKWKWGISWRFELPAGLNSNSEPLLIWSAREVEFFNTRVLHDKFHISQDKETGISHSFQSKVCKIATLRITYSFINNCCTGDHSWSLYRWYIFSTHWVSLSGALPHD